MTTLIARILIATGYRFPKHDGWFCRGSLGREALRLVGISCVACNVRADMME